jgi:hypothetical protein
VGNVNTLTLLPKNYSRLDYIGRSDTLLIMLTPFEMQNLANTLAIMDVQQVYQLAALLKSKFPTTATMLDDALYVAEMESAYADLYQPEIEEA